jgi:hypothetical protein
MSLPEPSPRSLSLPRAWLSSRSWRCGRGGFQCDDLGFDFTGESGDGRIRISGCFKGSGGCGYGGGQVGYSLLQCGDSRWRGRHKVPHFLGKTVDCGDKPAIEHATTIAKSGCGVNSKLLGGLNSTRSFPQHIGKVVS